MKNITMFLINFICLSHQMIMPARAAVTNPEDSWSNATRQLWNSIYSYNAALVFRAITDGADVNAQNSYGYTALIYATRTEHTDIVRILVNKTADVNIKDNYTKTALMYAAENGYTEIIRILINHKANVNAKSSNGLTALIYATRNGHTEIVRILVNKKADVNAKSNNGLTPLIEAARNGHEKIVDILMEKNININAQDNYGWTPLMYAAKNGHAKIVRILLAVGANPDISNKNGQTARKMNPKLINKAIEENIKLNELDQLAISALSTESKKNVLLSEQINSFLSSFEWPTNEEFEKIQATSELPFFEFDSNDL